MEMALSLVGQKLTVTRTIDLEVELCNKVGNLALEVLKIGRYSPRLLSPRPRPRSDPDVLLQRHNVRERKPLHVYLLPLLLELADEPIHVRPSQPPVQESLHTSHEVRLEKALATTSNDKTTAEDWRKFYGFHKWEENSSTRPRDV